MRLTRRNFFRFAIQAAGWTTAVAVPTLSPRRTAVAEIQRAAPSLSRHRYVIVNADDFGGSEAINAGVIEAHERGILSSASLLVDAPAAEAAVALAKRHPRLGLGLHVALERGQRGVADFQDLGAVSGELQRQIERFIALTKRAPTHIDSHHHVHRQFNIAHVFLAAGMRHHVPVRGFSDVVFVGRFYGQWTVGKTDLSHISSDYLISVLESLGPGVSEVSCHPAHRDSGFDAQYDAERAVELRALVDPRVKSALGASGIRLVNYDDYRGLRGATTATADVPCGSHTA